MGHSDSASQFVQHVADFVSQHTKIDSQTAMRYRINYALKCIIDKSLNICDRHIDRQTDRIQRLLEEANCHQTAAVQCSCVPEEDI